MFALKNKVNRLKEREREIKLKTNQANRPVLGLAVRLVEGPAKLVAR